MQWNHTSNIPRIAIENDAKTKSKPNTLCAENGIFNVSLPLLHGKAKQYVILFTFDSIVGFQERNHELKTLSKVIQRSP